ncbi:T9SS type A sorting domain-containing protein [Aquimarina sp. 2304DJ70-9]|uniref:T9SS type A sorting domain-containing protein n=1 Tax=Aquimarina penaris TaxID=3231044 RepID=UPI00346364DA
MKRKITPYTFTWLFMSLGIKRNTRNTRKLIAIIAFMFSFIQMNAQYTSIPDANFEAALARYDNIPGDGQVPTGSIQIVSSLEVKLENIADLTGIEDFTALRTLDCSNNNLTSLDLSNNTNLEEVYVEHNQLTHINIQNGSNARIQKFVAKDNSSLSCILVDDATFSANGWDIDTAITSFSDTFCRYTTIPDANFESALENLGYDDISGDGQVPTANIEVITSLFVVNKGISDLTGIEDFTALTTLHGGFNNLTSLDLSNNINLEGMYLQNNELTYLNLQNAANTNISNCNATNNSSLTCINVDDASPGADNIWLSIDVQTQLTDTGYCRYTSIPDANFESALGDLGYDNISGDGRVPTANIEVITGLDVNGKGISDLTGIEDFTALEYLSCAYSNLTSLDVSNNTNLENIRLEDNQLTYLNIQNGANANIGIFDTRNNSDLTCIFVDDAAYSTDRWTDIDDQTQFTNTDYCDYTLIPDFDFEGFLEVRGYDDISGDGRVPTELIETITALNVSNIGIGDLTGIEDFRDLTSLSCTNNGLDNLDLSNNTNLESIDLGNNSLTHLNLRNGTNTNITLFDTRGNRSLTCILVDDATYSTGNWTNIDSQTQFTATNFCDYTVIPDANFERALEGLGYDDISGDGQVPTANIEVITSLNVYQQNIANLTGIEDFTALNTLACTQNNLTSLDLSNNTNLEEIYLEVNQLTELNIRNGANTKIREFVTLVNSSLTCILVDDESYSTTNWTSIDSQTNFTDTDYCDYTTIPDANFESALEDLGYDDISGDGQVPTALIETVSSLNLFQQNIADLTGIEDFTALTTLSCFKNNLTSLDLSNNANLETVLAHENELTSIDVSNVQYLTTLSLADNDLIGLSLTDNIALEFLGIENNSISNIDLSNNKVLEYLNVYNNGLTSIDVSANTELVTLFLAKNSFTTVDITVNTKLKSLDVSNNVLTTIDLSNNMALELLNIDFNAIEDVDLTKHVNLKYFYANGCALKSLNVRNGMNTSILEFEITSNPDLACVEVDDTEATNAGTGNYSGWYKDATTLYSENCQSCEIYDNFQIQVISETCIDKNNGSIIISTNEDLAYSTEINGEAYTFTSTVSADNLAPGTYPFCITVEGDTNCEQCFEVNIEGAEKLAGKTTVSANELFVQVETGTAPFSVLINGKETASYTTNSFSLAVEHGDTVEVFSSLDCEGKLIAKQINLFDEITIAPNPTQGNVTVTIPSVGLETMQVDIYNALGLRVSSKVHTITSGSVVLPTQNLSAGIYFVSINEGGSKIFKIVKQ